MKSYKHITAAVLSFLVCGLGQIYLRRISKGLILLLSFSCALVIIWLGVFESEFTIADWDEKQLMFDPSQRSVSFRGQTLYMTDIMKLTGTVQLALTWVFGIVDAWREGKRQVRRKKP